jgi:hydroxymethylpyrimidine/phosphomethylpyrimidine kinase
VRSKANVQRSLRAVGSAEQEATSNVLSEPSAPPSQRQRSIQSPPVALTIAGSDSSAGAGLQADLKTFTALGVYGLTAVTCIVAETPGKVSRIEPVSSKILREQIAVLAKSFPIAAIKTGLLYSAEIISSVAQTLRNTGILSAAGRTRCGEPVRRAGFQPALVIDPVMIASSGDPLLNDDAIDLYQKDLFPLATLITPNLLEAERFLGQPIRDLKTMRHAGKELARKFQTSILLKGGHLAGDNAVDLLFADGRTVEFSTPFVRGLATHGTGCTYSAAITAGLASGLTLEDAIGRAKKFVSATIARHFRWTSRSSHNLDALNHLP